MTNKYKYNIYKIVAIYKILFNKLILGNKTELLNSVKNSHPIVQRLVKKQLIYKTSYYIKL